MTVKVAAEESPLNAWASWSPHTRSPSMPRRLSFSPIIWASSGLERHRQEVLLKMPHPRVLQRKSTDLDPALDAELIERAGTVALTRQRSPSPSPTPVVGTRARRDAAPEPEPVPSDAPQSSPIAARSAFAGRSACSTASSAATSPTAALARLR
jgi:hypothetical protein